MKWRDTEWNKGLQLHVSMNRLGFEFPRGDGHVNLIQGEQMTVKLGATITIRYQTSGRGHIVSLDPAHVPPGLAPNFRPMLFNGDWYDENGRWWPTGVNCGFLQRPNNEELTYTVKVKPALWANVWAKQSGTKFKHFLKKPVTLYLAFGGGISFSHGLRADGFVAFLLNSITVK